MPMIDGMLPVDAAAQPAWAVALAALIRHRYHRLGVKGWTKVDACETARHALEGLQRPAGWVPLSLECGATGLGMAFRCAGLCIDCLSGDRSCLLDHSESDEHTGPPSRLARSVPHSRALIKCAIASGYPVAAGLAVADSWIDVASVVRGTARIPGLDEPIVGGDCVVLTGWDDSVRIFTCLYTAGTVWGHNGLGGIPYEYILDRNMCYELITLPDDLDD